MDAVFNDKDEVHPVNVVNRNGALAGFDKQLVVEVPARCNAAGIEPIATPPLPTRVRGLVEMLAEYQRLAAAAAWHGTRADGVRALTANPLVGQIDLAERLYDEMAAAHRAYLPERLMA